MWTIKSPSFVLHLEEGYRIVADISAVNPEKQFDCRASECIHNYEFCTNVNFPCAGQNARGNG